VVQYSRSHADDLQNVVTDNCHVSGWYMAVDEVIYGSFSLLLDVYISTSYLCVCLLLNCTEYKCENSYFVAKKLMYVVFEFTIMSSYCSIEDLIAAHDDCISYDNIIFVIHLFLL